MALYRFTCTYKSGAGVWAEGETADLPDDLAAWLLRDVAGCIEPIVDMAGAEWIDAETGERADWTPQHDRQLKRAPRKR